MTNDDDEDKDISTRPPTERTEVLYGIENAMGRLTQVMSRVCNRADVCGDYLSPSFSMGVESIKKGYIEFKQRGVKIRFITEITKDNIHYCKITWERFPDIILELCDNCLWSIMC